MQQSGPQATQWYLGPTSAGLSALTFRLAVAFPWIIAPCRAGLAGPGGHGTFPLVQGSLWAGVSSRCPCWAVVTCRQSQSDQAP
jgi:hypothetical protein